jgi:hypothetical protein
LKAFQLAWLAEEEDGITAYLQDFMAMAMEPSFERGGGGSVRAVDARDLLSPPYGCQVNRYRMDGLAELWTVHGH